MRPISASFPLTWALPGILLLAGGAGEVAAQSAPTPADILARLPDGEDKRRFILDCTGCHQLTEAMVRPDGVVRSRESWRERVAQMLSFAGPRTGFPVISVHADAERYSAWLFEHLGAAAPAASAAPAPAVDTVKGARIREYALPDAGDLPHDLMLDGDGQVVVTGMMTGAMWVLEPGTGAFERVAIPRPQANPRALHVSGTGDWWVLLGFPRQLAHRTPEGEWSFHGLGVYPHSVAVDDSGGVWYNDHFARDSTLIFRLDPATGERRRFAVAPPEGWTPADGTTIPYGLRLGPDGTVWGTELAGNRILRLDPATGTSRAYPLPTSHSGPRRPEVASDGAVWVPEYASNRLARFDPGTERFREWELPIRDALPYIVRLDEARGRVWIGTAGANALLLFEPASERFTVVPMPSANALIRHMQVDPRTGAVWGAYSPSPSISPKVFRVMVP